MESKDSHILSGIVVIKKTSISLSPQAAMMNRASLMTCSGHGKETGNILKVNRVRDFGLSEQCNLAYLCVPVSKLLFLSAKPILLYPVFLGL